MRDALRAPRCPGARVVQNRGRGRRRAGRVFSRAAAVGVLDDRRRDPGDRIVEPRENSRNSTSGCAAVRAISASRLRALIVSPS